MPSPMVEHVSDTAFWTAQLRATESARPDALFQDPLAALLAGERGRQIAAGAGRGPMVGWTVVIRTLLIDEFVQRALSEGVDTVVNLGAGLDTRPYRMTLRETLRWVEVDHPSVIELKNVRLAKETPRCQLERVATDLADTTQRRQFFSDVQSKGKALLVLTEGVIPYLSPDDVAALADDVKALPNLRGWIVDWIAPETVAYRTSGRINEGGAPFRFTVRDWLGFFGEHGFESRELRYLADVGEKVGRPFPMPLLVKMAMRLRSLLVRGSSTGFNRFAGYMLLQPKKPA